MLAVRGRRLQQQHHRERHGGGENRADILEVERATGRWRIFASGLRNPNGLTFEPQTGALWTVVNERDELAPDLVPDYLTSVKDGGFYGWPYGYFGQNVDPRVEPQRPDLVAKAIVPDYALSSARGSPGSRILYRYQSGGGLSRWSFRRRTRQLGPPQPESLPGQPKPIAPAARPTPPKPPRNRHGNLLHGTLRALKRQWCPFASNGSARTR